MSKDYLTLAKSIVDKYDFSQYTKILLDYWEKFPTTLGHGFGHVLEVAVEAYEIALANSYIKPQELFIAGLFHDLYRPARGENAREEHHLQSLAVASQLLEQKVSQEFMDKFKYALEASDDWSDCETTPHFALFLSLGDKARHDPKMSKAYAWASNKYAREMGKELQYDLPVKSLYHFTLYQVGSWKVFMNYEAKGKERGIATYIETYSSIIDDYHKYQTSKEYLQALDQNAEQFRNLEEKYLREFSTSSDSLQKIMLNYY